jgi:hypothetical protein
MLRMMILTKRNAARKLDAGTLPKMHSLEADRKLNGTRCFLFGAFNSSVASSRRRPRRQIPAGFVRVILTRLQSSF